MADIETVQLIRDAKEFPDCHTAIVDHDGVEAFLAAGWKRADALDHDGNGKKGGSKPRKGRQEETAGEPALTRREVEADLIAMSVDFNPADDLSALRDLRDEARAIRDA